jgi:prepilin-type N-terminal cleavage/methylation domain-containing protein
MLARIRKSQEENEGGFTLIELLVVIIIIGILAAIAIPVFLNQRKKGYDAQSKSDLRNLATLEETYLTDNPTAYANSLTLLQATGYDFKQSANSGTITVTATGNTSYKLQAVNGSSGKTWCYDSAGGGGNAGVFQATSGTCP